MPVVGEDTDGVRRFFGVAPILTEGTKRGFLVIVGIPEAAVTAPADLSLKVSLVVSALVLVLSLVMAQVIAERGGFVPVIIKDTDDKIGIATVHDGPSLAQGEIIAPVVGEDPKNEETYHNKFQDPDKFLKAGGFREANAERSC